MRNLIFQIFSAILGLWLAVHFLAGVEFMGPWQNLILAGVILGLINFFAKPILKFITTPIRIATFGLFGLIINMALVWVVDLIFPELIISGVLALFWTTLIIWLLSFLFSWQVSSRFSKS